MLTEDLTDMPVHNRCQDLFNALLAEGISAEDVSEAMLSVAIAVRSKKYGPDNCGKALVGLGMGLIRYAHTEAAGRSGSVQ